jgi:hypothetical protein
MRSKGVSVYGCRKILDGLCYYCSVNPPYTVATYRTPDSGYRCGDTGGFVEESSAPGRLCPDCAVKAGLVW